MADTGLLWTGVVVVTTIIIGLSIAYGSIRYRQRKRSDVDRTDAPQPLKDIYRNQPSQRYDEPPPGIRVRCEG